MEGDDTVRDIFTDTDFQDRTVLHLITLGDGYPQLMEDAKMTVLLDKLWQGDNSQYCDGRMTDYSKLTVMSKAQLKRLPGEKIEFSDIMLWNQQRDIKTEYFTQQFIFRRTSIALIFQKGFYTSCIIVVIFSYINIQY